MPSLFSFLFFLFFLIPSLFTKSKHFSLPTPSSFSSSSSSSSQLSSFLPSSSSSSYSRSSSHVKQSGSGSSNGWKIFGPIIGTLMVIFGVSILWNNEKNSIKNYKILMQKESECVPIGNEGAGYGQKFVHVTGESWTEEVLKDSVFANVEVKNCFKMIRVGEIFQWCESLGKKNHPSYRKEWCSQTIDSSSFRNPYYHNDHYNVQNLIGEVAQESVHVQLGIYTFSKELRENRTRRDPIDLNDQSLFDIRHEMIAKNGSPPPSSYPPYPYPPPSGYPPSSYPPPNSYPPSSYPPPFSPPPPSDAQLSSPFPPPPSSDHAPPSYPPPSSYPPNSYPPPSLYPPPPYPPISTIRYPSIKDNMIYLSKSAYETSVGDVRVSFYKITCGLNSVVAELKEDNVLDVHLLEPRLEDPVTRKLKKINVFHSFLKDFNGFCNFCCKLANMATMPLTQIGWIMEGQLTKEQVFQRKLEEENLRKAGWRFGGWLIICLGFYAFFGPLYLLLKFIPLIGSLLSAIGQFVGLILGLILGTILSLLVGVFSWLFYRPLFSIGLLIFIGALIGLLFIK